MKTRKIISIILIALLLFTTKVYAANNSYSTTIKASSNEVKREENITITIGLSNIAIESGEKGIGAYTAKIVYDSSVLEYVTTNGTDKWDSPFYQNGLITSTTKDGTCVNSNQNIGTITFKVKKNAKLGNTTIKLAYFYGSIGVVSNGEESDIKAQDKQVTIKVVGESTSKPTPTPTQKPTATPTNKPTNTPKPTSTIKPTNTPKPTATVKPSSNGSGSNNNNTNTNSNNSANNNSNNNGINNSNNNNSNNDNNSNQINNVENVNIIGNGVQEINSNNTNENIQETNTQNLDNILNIDNTEETDDYSMLIWIAVIIFFGIVIAIIALIILNKKMK